MNHGFDLDLLMRRAASAICPCMQFCFMRNAAAAPVTYLIPTRRMGAQVLAEPAQNLCRRWLWAPGAAAATVFLASAVRGGGA